MNCTTHLVCNEVRLFISVLKSLPSTPFLMYRPSFISTISCSIPFNSLVFSLSVAVCAGMHTLAISTSQLPIIAAMPEILDEWNLIGSTLSLNMLLHRIAQPLYGCQWISLSMGIPEMAWQHISGMSHKYVTITSLMQMYVWITLDLQIASFAFNQATNFPC